MHLQSPFYHIHRFQLFGCGHLCRAILHITLAYKALPEEGLPHSPFSMLQSHLPSFWFFSVPYLFFPQGLCTCCDFCQGCYIFIKPMLSPHSGSSVCWKAIPDLPCKAASWSFNHLIPLHYFILFIIVFVICLSTYLLLCFNLPWLSFLRPGAIAVLLSTASPVSRCQHLKHGERINICCLTNCSCFFLWMNKMNKLVSLYLSVLPKHYFNRYSNKYISPLKISTCLSLKQSQVVRKLGSWIVLWVVEQGFSNLGNMKKELIFRAHTRLMEAESLEVGSGIF